VKKRTLDNSPVAQRIVRACAESRYGIATGCHAETGEFVARAFGLNNPASTRAKIRYWINIHARNPSQLRLSHLNLAQMDQASLDLLKHLVWTPDEPKTVIELAAEVAKARTSRTKPTVRLHQT
jgi:hypothetical protein